MTHCAFFSFVKYKSFSLVWRGLFSQQRIGLQSSAICEISGFVEQFLHFFQTLHSYQSTKEHFLFCQRMNYLPYPVTFLILIQLNHLFVVLNSSINFIIYCAVRKSFRQRIWTILKRPFKTLVTNAGFTIRKSPTTINHSL